MGKITKVTLVTQLAQKDPVFGLAESQPMFFDATFRKNYSLFCWTFSLVCAVVSGAFMTRSISLLM